MEVRQAQAADWQTLRELRLRALADAPDAFASILEREAVFPEQVWRQRAEGGEGSVNFIASVDPRHRRRGSPRPWSSGPYAGRRNATPVR
jgi:hypothetical protein